MGSLDRGVQGPVIFCYCQGSLSSAMHGGHHDSAGESASVAPKPWLTTAGNHWDAQHTKPAIYRPAHHCCTWCRSWASVMNHPTWMPTLVVRGDSGIYAQLLHHAQRQTGMHKIIWQDRMAAIDDETLCTSPALVRRPSAVCTSCDRAEIALAWF